MSVMIRLAKNILGFLPNEGRFIKRAARRFLVKKELTLRRMNRSANAAAMPDPRTVYWIDPMRIHLHTSLKTDSPDWEAWVFAQRGRIRTVQDGEWDVSELRVADMRVCRAVDARINNGASWQSSDYYQTAIRDIEAGRHVFACKDRSDFDRHCVELDKLIESIAKTGYQESSRLDDTASIDSSLGHQEIIVNISREGFPLFQDGRHRLAVARTLKINRIPVQILVRHEEWQAFRSFMQRMARGSGGAAKEGFLYQDPIHFDLGDIPALHGCEDRWEAMSANLPAGSGAALDIGCNLGYFCHGLERKGYSPIGVEYLPDIAYAAQKIARAEKMKFKIVEGDILSDETKVSIGDGEFAVVVAVNIFHHFIKTEAGFKRLERFMKDLNCRTMFFESHHPDDPQMQGAYMNPTPAEFAQKIGEWGRFQFISPIYSAADGRTIFALSR